MRCLAGCVTLALLLVGGPLAAQEATGEAVAAAGVPAAPATDTETTAPAAPAGETALAAAAAGAPSTPILPVTLVVNADLRTQRVTVTENGKANYVWPISSGRAGYATPTGSYRPNWASKMWFSRQYEYAPMPHAVFFTRGVAFHGTSAVGLLGRPASHGCIRLAPGNAAQLYKLVHKHGFVQTKIVVHGGSKRQEPAIARREPGSREAKLAARSGQRREVASTRVAGQRRIYRVSRYGF